MLFRLFLAFTLIPIIELYLLMKMAAVVGALNTIMVAVVTGFLGAWLAKREGIQTLLRVQESMRQGLVPSGELLDAVLIFIAGVVLLTPGFITDIAGLLLLLAPVRSALKKWIKHKFENLQASGHIHTIDID